jgi:hypothetical protein
MVNQSANKTESMIDMGRTIYTITGIRTDGKPLHQQTNDVFRAQFIYNSWARSGRVADVNVKPALPPSKHD